MGVEETKAIARRFVDIINKHDYDLVDEILAEDFVNHNPPPLPGAPRDREGVKLISRTFSGAFPDLRAEVEDVIAEGDRVVLYLTLRGTHENELMGIPATGREINVGLFHIFRIENGKIAERWGEFDAYGMMQQLGAVPEPAQLRA